MIYEGTEGLVFDVMNVEILGTGVGKGDPGDR